MMNVTHFSVFLCQLGFLCFGGVTSTNVRSTPDCLWKTSFDEFLPCETGAQTMLHIQVTNNIRTELVQQVDLDVQCSCRQEFEHVRMNTPVMRAPNNSCTFG